MYANARHDIFTTLANAFKPREHLTTSEWAEKNIVLSSRESPEPGPWRNDRNPLLKEPMDCTSTRSGVRQLVLKWPIQFGKTQLMTICSAYRAVCNPAPILIMTANDHLREKLVDQKYAPMFENPAVKAILKTTNSRDSANRRFYKDFLGGMMFFEHAVNTQRLKMISVRDIFCDEVSSIALALGSFDDTFQQLQGRVSAFASNSLEVYVSSPGIEGFCQVSKLYDLSDQRRYHVPCPHCLKLQHLVWENLHYDHHKPENCWYVCEHCGCTIEEKHKTEMIRAGRWIAEYPHRSIRGYTANCLYYPIGLGPRWPALVKMWREANHG